MEEAAPFALIATERGVRRLYAVDEAAAGLGLYVGQKATDALALVPELAAADADPAGDLAALEALVLWCVRFSPAVALDPPDGLLLDVSGVAHLWGGEPALLDDLMDRLARQGIPARGAIAGSAGAAWALARCGEDRAVAPPDTELELLAPLPVTGLRLEPETAAQLMRLGLVRIGQLAALPRGQLARRFGQAVLTRLDQALARTEEALIFQTSRYALVRPPRLRRADQRAGGPRRAPAAISRCASARGWRPRAGLRGASSSPTTGWTAAPSGVSSACRCPAAGPSAIARLFAPMLETRRSRLRDRGGDAGRGGSRGVARAADHAATSIREIAPEDGLAPLVDRLANRLGEARVWRAEPYPSHIPERAVTRKAPLAPGDGRSWAKERPRPVRLFARPEPIEATAPIPDDPPLFFHWRGRIRRVRRAEGPERLAEEWWRRAPGESGVADVRDYYRVEDDTGARYWLFRAGLYGAR